MRTPQSHDLPARMNRQEAAAYLGVSVATMAQDSVTQRHKFPVLRIGKRCVYLRSHLDAYISSHTQNAPNQTVSV